MNILLLIINYIYIIYLAISIYIYTYYLDKFLCGIVLVLTWMKSTVLAFGLLEHPVSVAMGARVKIPAVVMCVVKGVVEHGGTVNLLHHGKIMENHGKIMGKSWKIMENHGKIMENHGM